MSMHSVEEITCPKCGKESDFLVWGSINTTIDPEMKEKVRTGEAFKWTCPECGYQADVDYTTLYHQMEDNVMIYYVTGNPSDAIDFMQNGHDGPGMELINKVQSELTKRVVCNRNQFREKLFILDAGLDDRVVELMKLFIAAHLEKNNPDLTIEEFLFETIDGKPGFSIRIQDGKWGSTDFIQDVYDGIREDFEEIIKEDGDVVIDREWALKALNKKTTLTDEG